MNDKTDIVGDIMDFEGGTVDPDRIVPFFQGLIDSGLAWTLQGSYGRAAQHLIDNDHCHKPGAVTVQNV